jgi:hypothetical protein
MDVANPDPPPRQEQGPVLRRIYSIIGVYPSRSDLIEICSTFGWGPLTRTEKRVKRTLLMRLESLDAQILPFLNSPEGIDALEKAYIGMLKQEQKIRPSVPAPAVAPAIPVAPALPVAPIPPYASVSFYLNQRKTFV